ncbi:hypothetical protein [Mycolicibacterium hodleri]|nr:hypothetical protein [Mycolicibacterium hodleri]
MTLKSIVTYTRSLVLGTGAIIMVSTLAACSNGTNGTPAAETPASIGSAMPAMANFISDMAADHPSAMTTMAIAVEGDRVVAYATNGINDEAYFFGTQTDGRMDLTSTFADHLTASYDGSKVDGELVMNEEGAAPQRFAASRVEAPAGIYTAAHGTSRATWVARPDRSLVGVMNNSAPGDHKVTDAIATQDQQFKDEVRQKRLEQRMQQAPTMTFGTWTMEMDGKKVTAVPVTGGMTF